MKPAKSRICSFCGKQNRFAMVADHASICEHCAYGAVLSMHLATLDALEEIQARLPKRKRKP